MKAQIVAIFLVLTARIAVAQISFEPVPPPMPAPQITYDFVKVERGSAAFADVNGDGYLDVLITGDLDATSSANTAAGLYINNGRGSYMQAQNVPFDKVTGGSIDFADIDGDGDQDVLITGYFNATNIRTKLYKNDGSGIFTVFADEHVLLSVGSGDADFADIDGDGDQDLLIIGSNNQQGTSRLYENDGSGNYTLIDNMPFTPVWGGTTDFGDVDGDGDQDLLITGAHKINSNTQVTTSELYLNDGQGNFTISTNSSIVKVHRSTANFADLDGDNDLDIFITGDTTYNGNDGQFTAMYLNDGSGKFTPGSGSSFTNVQQGAVDIADIDHDGDLDILLTGDKGYNKGGNTAELYTNDGSGNFTMADEATFPKVSNGSVSFADINGDSSPDVLVTGGKGSRLGGNVASLYYSHGNGTFDVIPRSSFIEVGNNQQYYAAAAFADVDNDGDPDLIVSGETDSTNATILYYNWQGSFYPDWDVTERPVSNLPELGDAALDFADVDNDGDQDVLFAGYGRLPGESSYKRLAVLYKYNLDAKIYEEADRTTFTAVTNATIRFADVDNDSDHDVLIMGSSGSNTFSTELYFNDGTGNYTLSSNPFTSMSRGDAAFADVNGDGYKDLFLTGYNAGSKAELYLNDGSGGFSLSDDQTFEKVYNSSVAFTDVDGDNDMDLFVSGDGDGSYNTVGNIYLNDGQGNYTLQPASSIKGVKYSSAAFTDLDADGDPDLILTGIHNPGSNTTGIQICEAYTNDGSGNFSVVSGTPFWGFTGVQYGELAVSDINNDNSDDVLFVGWSHSGRASKLFKNTVSEDCETDPCDNIICPEGLYCYEGTCFDACASSGDPDDTLCLNLGPNLIAPSGAYVGLDAGTGFDIYNWSTGDTTQSILVLSSGQYWVIAYDTTAQRYSTDTLNVLFKAKADGECPGGLFEQNGYCFLYDELCDEVDCPEGDFCYGGTCYPVNVCDENDPDSECFIEAPCDNIICPQGQACYEGGCYDLCSGSSCPPDSGLIGSPGSSIVLSAVDYFGLYSWSTGETTNEITVDVSGKYSYSALSLSFVEPYSTYYADSFYVLIMADPELGCPEGQVEKDGYCFRGGNIFDPNPPDPCETVTCPEGYECFEGDCRPACEDINCEDGSVCYKGICFKFPDCDDVICEIGLICKYGQCFRGCVFDSDCPDGTVCVVDICVVPEEACDYIDCPIGSLCITGDCYPYNPYNNNSLNLNGGLFSEISAGLKALANTPIGGVTIYLFNELQTEINAFATTDENGLYSFNNLPPGTYMVFIDSPPYKIKGDGLITLKSDFNTTKLDIVLVNGEYELQLEYVTGLAEHLINNESFTLFPNPSHGKIMLSSNVEIGEVDIRILDVTGRLITQKTMQIHKSEEINIADLKNEPSGLKIVLLYQNGQIIYKSTLIYKPNN